MGAAIFASGPAVPCSTIRKRLGTRGSRNGFGRSSGLTADFRGYYGTAITNNFQFQVFKPAMSQYTFMGGPQYRYFQNQHWALHAQVLAGLAHGNFSTGLGSLRGAPVGLYPNGNVFALDVGAPIDYNLGPTLALRLTPNYLLTRFGSEFQQNLGFTSGVVFRWGRQ